MPWPFGSDQNDIDILGRNDGFEVDGEAVGKQERLALAQVGRDVRLENGGLLCVWQSHENNIRPPHRFRGQNHFKTSFLGDRDGLAAFVESDDDIEAAFFQVERMRMALRSEAEHGQGFVLENV